MTAVDQRDELNRLGPAEIGQRIERGARRPAGIEHVVDEHDGAAVDRERNFGLAHQRRDADGRAHQVVAIERDVERADRDLFAGDLAQVGGDALRDRHTAAAHADEREIGKTAIVFEDFVGDSRERA